MQLTRRNLTLLSDFVTSPYMFLCSTCVYIYIIVLSWDRRTTGSNYSGGGGSGATTPTPSLQPLLPPISTPTSHLPKAPNATVTLLQKARGKQKKKTTCNILYYINAMSPAFGAKFKHRFIGIITIILKE